MGSANVAALGPTLTFGGRSGFGKAEARLHLVALLADGIMRVAIREADCPPRPLRIIDNKFNSAGSAPAVAKLPPQFTC